MYTTVLASSKEKNILPLFLSFFLLAAKTVAIIVKSNAVMIDVIIRVVCLCGSSRIATQHQGVAHHSSRLFLLVVAVAKDNTILLVKTTVPLSAFLIRFVVNLDGIE